MEKDKHITEVMFRKDKSGEFKGDITAVFPYIVSGYAGEVEMYARSGGHFSAEYFHIINTTVPACPEEYKDLKKGMEQYYGYNLRIVQKRNYNRYLQEYYKMRELWKK